MTRSRRQLRRLRRAPLAVVAAALSLGAGCGRPQAPEALVELRQAVGGEPLAVARQAAPDLVAEAERSLELAERSLDRRDLAVARRMATLGIIQARTAFAMARQGEAERRLSEARSGLAQAEEDLARFRSEREDAIRELQRLEALGRSADRADEPAAP